MATPNALFARNKPATLAWQSGLSFPLLAALSLVTCAAGIGSLVQHHLASDQEHVLATAGIVLLASGLLQAQIIGRLWRNRGARNRQFPLATLRFWRRLVTGAFVAYLAALAVGPVAYIACAWCSAVTVWYSILLLPLAASAPALETWRKWSQDRRPRRLAWLVYAPMLLVVGAEIGLRGHDFLRQLPAPATVIGAASDLAISLDVGRIGGNLRGDRAASLRIAIVAPGVDLSGLADENYLTRVRAAMPGLDVVPIGLSRPWSNARRDDWAAKLGQCKPDMALAVISVCEEVRDLANGSSDWFDWHELAIARRLLGTDRPSISDERVVLAASDADDFESYLTRLTRKLTICRTPTDAATQAHWRQTFAAIDQLIADCRHQDIPVAIMLVPGVFQVNRGLCATVVRRAGCEPEQFDVDLPQRRWARFAQERRVPTLDLLPSLRLCRQAPYERNTLAWNAEGHRTAADALGGWLQSRYADSQKLAIVRDPAR